MSSRRLLPAAVALGLVAACGSDASRQPDGGSTPPPATALAGAPSLEIDVLADGLDHPWDVVQAPDGTVLVAERGGGFTAVRSDGGSLEVTADFGDLFADGETGLMGLALDPAFDQNRRLYSCQGVEERGGVEIQVIAWTVASDWTTATRVDDPLVPGIPVNAETGRHGGCRLAFGADGALFVGTGDNAVGQNPQDRTSQAGKVLRVDPATGDGLPDNPFADDAATRRIWTYGHRNVQGLAPRPGTGQMYSVEHGPDRDDEVNLLRAGGNYGWDPDGDDGGYDESVPMTAPELSGAVESVWSSGSPALAPSGGTFLEGSEWGDYDGLMLLALLRGQGVLALGLDADGDLVEHFRIPELDAEYGRIRAVRQGTDGALYVITDNGSNDDVVLRVTPV
jgi:glucose/arabinose dehydrogenase